MKEYRAYVVGHSGGFLRFEGFVSPNDAAAIEHAKQFVDGHDIELWNLERLVVKFNHQEK